MSTVYLDTCTIIYLVEAGPTFHEAALASLAPYQADSNAVVVSSRLARLECRVKPLRDGNAALLAVYDGFFHARRMVLTEITASVIERATDLRARYRVRTPDAIHLATAIEAQATVFITGDATLTHCKELHVHVIER